MGYWIGELEGDVFFTTVVDLYFNYSGATVTIQGVHSDGTLGTADFPLS